jgi:hypothetical protein
MLQFRPSPDGLHSKMVFMFDATSVIRIDDQVPEIVIVYLMWIADQVPEIV